MSELKEVWEISICSNDMRALSEASQSIGNVPGHCIDAVYSPNSGRIRFLDAIGSAAPIACPAGCVRFTVTVPMTRDDVQEAVIMAYDRSYKRKKRRNEPRLYKVKIPENCIRRKDIDGNDGRF